MNENIYNEINESKISELWNFKQIEWPNEKINQNNQYSSSDILKCKIRNSNSKANWLEFNSGENSNKRVIEYFKEQQNWNIFEFGSNLYLNEANNYYDYLPFECRTKMIDFNQDMSLQWNNISTNDITSPFDYLSRDIQTQVKTGKVHNVNNLNNDEQSYTTDRNDELVSFVDPSSPQNEWKEEIKSNKIGFEADISKLDNSNASECNSPNVSDKITTTLDFLFEKPKIQKTYKHDLSTRKDVIYKNIMRIIARYFK